VKTNFLLSLALVLLVSSSAGAYSVSTTNSGFLVRWSSNILQYELDADGTSSITNGSDLQAVRAGAASWNPVGCSSVAVTEVGTTTINTTVITEGQLDGHNVVVWIEGNRWSFGSLVLGVTAPVFDNIGRVVEADIAFNGTARWATNGGNGIDVESVAVHELGHFVGLQHVLDGNTLSDPPTMSPALLPRLQGRTLSMDDELGACFLYPAGTFVCAINADCPRVVDVDQNGKEFYSGQLTCAAGQCDALVASGSAGGPLGSPCRNTGECEMGLVCVDSGARGAICSRLCDLGMAGCPMNYACMPLPASEMGACLAESPPPVTTGKGGTAGTQDPLCLCDNGPSCDEGCGCDSDCGACSCDSSTACDATCSCDPECQGGGGGCAAIDAPLPKSLALIALLPMLAFWRKRKRVV